MKLGMYSICDCLTGFMTPVLEQNDAAALRNFSMACDPSKPDRSLMSWKPSNFAIYKIAVFDSETGIVEPLSPIQCICEGSSLGGTSREG